MKEAKSTYWQLLRRPEWQKRRLEMLSKSEWTCSSCMATDANLHVHHRQYFKDRMPWDYTDDQLIVVCDICHESEHYLLDELKEIVSRMDTYDAVGLLAGFAHKNPTQDQDQIQRVRFVNPKLFFNGLVALAFNDIPFSLRPKALKSLKTFMAPNSIGAQLADEADQYGEF